MQANANLLEISGFGHKLSQAGCDPSLASALTQSMGRTSTTISQERQKLEAGLGVSALSPRPRSTKPETHSSSPATPNLKH